MNGVPQGVPIFALALVLSAPAAAQTSFSSFETDMEGWAVDATDTELAGGHIAWHIKRSSARAWHGATSLEYYLDNKNDAGKIWIEKPFAVPPGEYDVVVSYRLGSITYGEVGTFSVITNVTSYDPEVRSDLALNARDTTYNGGIRDWVWLDKRYAFRVLSDGRLYVAIGIWGNFEVTHFYHVDAVTVAITPAGSGPTPTPTPTPGLVEVTPGGSAVSASTSDSNLPANTVDNNLATRWSGNGDGAWIRHDLGAIRTLAMARIAVYGGNSRRNRFDLQVSTDNVAWTTVLANATNSGTTTLEETYDFGDVPARYFRYVGHGSTAGTWNSLTEVSLFSPVGITPTPTATPGLPSPTPTPTATPGYVEVTPPALRVTASTQDANVPGNTVDNNLATRWSGYGDGAWMQYDLGSTRSVGFVTIAVHQGNARRNRFDLQVATDTTAWTTVLAGALSSGTTTAEETYTFTERPARYIRYVGHGSNLGLWNSVAEVSVFARAVP